LTDNGRLYEQCLGRQGDFVYPQHIRKMLDEARNSFPMVNGRGDPLPVGTLRWFAKYFGEDEKIKVMLDMYFAEYLASHLRDGDRIEAEG